MTSTQIFGLSPVVFDLGAGLCALRFSRDLDRTEQAAVRAALRAAGAISGEDDDAAIEVDPGAAGEEPDDEPSEATCALPERSRFVHGPFDGADGPAIAAIRACLDELAARYGALTAVFAVAPTEVDALAAMRAEEGDEAEDDEDDEAEDEEGDEDDEDDEAEDDEGDEVEVSHWKAGPPPAVDVVEFPLDRYPEILDEYDWEDFGIALKFAGEPVAGERELVEAFHEFWLAPYVDAAVAWPGGEDEQDGDDADELPPPPWRHASVTWDDRHHAALLWVDRFTAPAKAVELVGHLLWVVSQLHRLLPIAHARFAEATMEMKYGELMGQQGPVLVLAGNPLLRRFEAEGEAAALAWADGQDLFSPIELAAMLVEVGTHHDPEGESGSIALRMFDAALARHPENQDAAIYALLVLALRGDLTEALARVDGRPELAAELLATVSERAFERIDGLRSLFTPEVFTELADEVLAKLLARLGDHRPELLAPALAAVPATVEAIAPLHRAFYLADDTAAQLAVAERVLELPLPDEGMLREAWLSALNSACICAHTLGDISKAVAIADRAAPFADENPYLYHSAACAYASCGDMQRAFQQVQGAVRTHYDHLDRLEVDTDLKELLEWPEFKALFAEWRARRAASEPVLTATDDDFNALVLGHPKPVLVDFTASWCGPCQQLAPLLTELATESGGRFRVVKLDVDDHAQTAARYEVTAMPTLLVFRGGEVAARHTGFLTKPGLRRLLREGGAALG